MSEETHNESHFFFLRYPVKKYQKSFGELQREGGKERKKEGGKKKNDKFVACNWCFFISSSVKCSNQIPRISSLISASCFYETQVECLDSI